MKMALGKRGGALLAGLILIALVLAAFSIKPAPEPAAIRINGHTVLRIRTGMTREDVEAIFRVPPGEYSSTADPDNPDKPTPSVHRPGLEWEKWGGERAVLFVHFGPDGRADDWEAHIRHSSPKLSRVDNWLEVIKYKWLGL
jgi:hypothetical protein